MLVGVEGNPGRLPGGGGGVGPAWDIVIGV